MWSGLPLLLGSLWAGIGIMVATARMREYPIFLFYSIGASVGSLVCWLAYLALENPTLNHPEAMADISYLGLAALFNCTGQSLVMYNLRSGGRSLAFALPQISFLVPLFFSVSMWNEQMNGQRLLGLSALVGSVFMMTGSGSSQSVLTPKRILVGIGTIILCGTSQVMIMLGSHHTGAGVSSLLLSTALVLSASAITYVTGAVISYRIDSKSRPWIFPKGLIPFGVAWGILAILSYLILFQALEGRTQVNGGGMVFAIASASNILVFALVSKLRLKEQMTLRSVSALMGIILGILVMRLC